MSSERGAPEPGTAWRPAASPVEAAGGVGILSSVRRGVLNRCPNCGEGRVFGGFLRIVPECPACAAPLGTLRADDAPPYIVIFLAGHLLLPPIFWIERAYEPPMWLHMAVWLPLFAIVCTLLLRPVKGGVVGLMWKLGFGEAGHPQGGANLPPGTRHDV